jgi:hypothetical protein
MLWAMIRRHPGYARPKYAAATDGGLAVAKLWNNEADKEMCKRNY